MNFDINKTLSLIKGGLLDHEATWQSYLDDNPGWMQTTVSLTGPLLVFNVVLSLVFSRIVGGYAFYAHSNFFMALVLGLVMAAIGITVAAFVFSFLAGIFKGKHNFDRAFAAISLAAIPAWLAGPVAALVPFIGFLLALAGGILSLFFLYKIIPLALGVPDEKRVVHFVVSLVAVIVINMFLGLMMGAGQSGAGRDAGFSSTKSSLGSGTLGEIERQGRLMDAAEADQFEPPADGKLSSDQVSKYVSVMRKTRAVQEEHTRELQKMAAEIEAKQAAGESASASDMVRMYSGIGTGMNAMNAEMEVVKTGGGNWAEHQWVKTQLRSARIQQGEGSGALEHNYGLYRQFEEELENLGSG